MKVYRVFLPVCLGTLDNRTWANELEHFCLFPKVLWKIRSSSQNRCCNIKRCWEKKFLLACKRFGFLVFGFFFPRVITLGLMCQNEKLCAKEVSLKWELSVQDENGQHEDNLCDLLWLLIHLYIFFLIQNFVYKKWHLSWFADLRCFP